MNEIRFNGETYHDDRMFLLYVCKCTVDIDDDVVSTMIYHEEAPGNHKWCVVTYRNITRSIAARVDHFDSENEAIAYVKNVEATVPLISLGGRAPHQPLPYDQYVKWKERNQFKEYDYKKMYLLGGTNPREMIITKQCDALDPVEGDLRALLKAEPDNSQAWHNLGVHLSAKRKLEEAIRCVRAAIQHGPDNADSILFLARLCAETGLSDEALTHLDRLIARRQYLGKSVCFKAQVLANSGRGRDAIVLLESFLEETPEDDMAWFILCGIAEAQNDIHKALRAASTCEGILQRRGVQADSDDVRWARGKVQDLRARLGT